MVDFKGVDVVVADHLWTAIWLIQMDDDPISRFHTATEVAAWAKRAMVETRREAITELRARGLTLAEIGDDLGLSRARIDQLAHGK